MLIACGGSGGVSSSEDGVLRVSGTITVQRDSDIDLDLNSSILLNNELDDPQLIANPSTIGGYLSGYSGAYANASNTTFNQDTHDYFKVSLVKGQEIQISVFQADSSLDVIELELALFDEFEVKQETIDINEFSSNTLIVPADGLYTLSLGVSTLTSPLLYTLSLSQSISSQALSVSDIKILSQDFIPGEILLKLKKGKAIPATDNTVKSASSTPLKTASNNTDSIESLLEKLRQKETIPNIATVYQVQPSSKKPSIKIANYTEASAIKQLSLLEQKIQTLEIITQLNESEDVEFAEPNFIYHSAASKDDPRLSDQWNLSMLSAPAAWQLSSGQDVIVAVLDTGINATHEDLTNNIHPGGYDFITDTKSSGDGNGFDGDPKDEGTSFHGSHVAGIIAAEADNMKGIAGLAYDAKIMPLRVLGVQDTGSSSDIAQAILYAAGLENTSGNSLRADIINMSFGSEAQSATVKAALDKAYAQGLILIAAAGNIATDSAFYPAAFENVIGVGAVSNDKKRSSFSNFGINLDLVAPGGTGSGSATFDGFQDAILSTVGANNYSEYIGTSMAAPHVSAVAALIKQLMPSLNGENFKAALDAGYLTQNLTTSTADINNFYGKGLIDAAKSVNWAKGNVIMPGILSVYPTQFGFIGANTKAELSLTNPSDSVITITSIVEQESWLEITAKDDVDDISKLGNYLVEVNLALASLGQGIITINYEIDNGPAQQQIINVFISRASQGDPSVGNLYVSLYKEEDVLNGVYQQAYGLPAELTNGVYEYCFNYVAPGRYLLAASTDNDGDRLPFDKGEAVGSFPLLSRPSFIEIKTQSLTNMNFDIQYPSFSSSEISFSILPQQNTHISSLIFESTEWAPVSFIAQSNCSK
jgi:serine protease